MQLTDKEVTVVKAVLHRFLNLKQASPRRHLLAQLRSSESLRHLTESAILRSNDYDATFLPTALAFVYCADEGTLREAKRAVQLLAHVVQNLSEVDLDKSTFTVGEIQDHARKMYSDIEPNIIELGLYLAPEFGLLAGWPAGNPPQYSPTASLVVNERVLEMEDPKSLWERFVKNYENLLKGYEEKVGEPPSAEPEDLTPMAMAGGSRFPSDNSILVLISHSSKDAELAQSLIELLRLGLDIPANRIRCSSVDGYRLPAGVNTDSQLRNEVSSARVVIGLITPNSLASPYVLFELGARWGKGDVMIPLLAGVMPNELRGPLSGFNALSCSNEAQLHQLLGDIGTTLRIAPESPASYFRFVATLREMADGIATAPSIPVNQKSGGHATAESKRAQLVIHPRGRSTYIAMTDRTKIYVQFNLAIENKGTRTSNIDKFRISVPKAQIEFSELEPAYPLSVHGRLAVYALPGPGLAADGHITIAPETMIGRGKLAFFVPFAPPSPSSTNPQQLEPIDCMLTIFDTEGAEASHEFRVEEQ